MIDDMASRQLLGWSCVYRWCRQVVRVDCAAYQSLNNKSPKAIARGGSAIVCCSQSEMIASMASDILQEAHGMEHPDGCRESEISGGWV